jgi:hypothetical protein
LNGVQVPYTDLHEDWCSPDILVWKIIKQPQRNQQQQQQQQQAKQSQGPEQQQQLQQRLQQE